MGEFPAPVSRKPSPVWLAPVPFASTSATSAPGMASLWRRFTLLWLPRKPSCRNQRDLFREDVLDGKGLSRSFVFITGPSATADMGPLVRGVHGPHRLHIIVLR